MTGEEMERAIEFLLKSQAQLTADIQSLTVDVQGLKEGFQGLKEAVQGLKEVAQGLTDVQTQTSRDVAALASNVGELTGVVVNLAEIVARMETEAETDRREMRRGFDLMETRMKRFEAQAESDRQEIREAVSGLTLANEITRALTEQVASLEVKTSQRVTHLDDRVTDLESKLP
ncbi:MAG: hypothetical protein L0229_03900 [Blastocatellia bacterium]|nr:hypothetical protein [Blastocatellia bacterium]